MKMTEQELAKMSEDVFASNLENKLWATDDGCFFKLERQAREHAVKIDSLVTLFERDKSENESEITEDLTSVKTTVEVPVDATVEATVEDKSAKPKKK